MPFIPPRPGPGLPRRRKPLPRRMPIDRMPDAVGGTPALSRGHKLGMKAILPSTGTRLGGRGYGGVSSGGKGIDLGPGPQKSDLPPRGVTPSVSPPSRPRYQPKRFS